MGWCGCLHHIRFSCKVYALAVVLCVQGCSPTQPACGSEGRGCCEGGGCGEDLICNSSTFVCVRSQLTAATCGLRGQPCCAGGVCGLSGVFCSDGTCKELCGKAGSPCCGESFERPCDAGLDCQSGTCFPPEGACEAQDRCEGCVGAGCGWCTGPDGQGSCRRGSLLGLPGTCFRWDFGDPRTCRLETGFCGDRVVTDRAAGEFAGSTSCGACLTGRTLPGSGEVRCGWCQVSPSEGRCLPGLEYGALGASCNLGWLQTGAQCCEQNSGCDDCTQWPSCRLCSTSGLCSGDADAFCAGAWVNSPSLCDADNGVDEGIAPPPPPDCRSQTTCDGCDAEGGCSWCVDETTGTASCELSSDGCPGSSVNLDCATCSDGSSCEACLAVPGCKWCESGLEVDCVNANISCPSGTNPVTTQCI